MVGNSAFSCRRISTTSILQDVNWFNKLFVRRIEPTKEYHTSLLPRKMDKKFLDERKDYQESMFLRARHLQFSLPFSYWSKAESRSSRNVYEICSYTLKRGTIIECGIRKYSTVTTGPKKALNESAEPDNQKGVNFEDGQGRLESQPLPYVKLIELYLNSEKKVAKLENKLETAEKKLMALAVKSRIEDLQKLLWPRFVTKPNSRRTIFIEILTSEDPKFTNHPNVIEFRKLFMESGFSLNFFINTLVDLYGECSNCAAHHVPFPKEITREFIKELVRDLGLTPDQSRIAAVELIIKPLLFNHEKLKDEL